MTSERLAIYILAALVVVLNSAFTWHAIKTDAKLARMREEIAATDRRLELARLKSTDLCPKQPHEV